MEIKDLIPDPLNQEKVVLCGGVIRPYEKMEEDKERIVTSQVFAADGVLAEKLKCHIVYGDYTLWQVLQKWSEEGYEWLHTTSGWTNGLTIRACLSPYLSDKQFREILVGDIKENLKNSLTPPIRFNYLLGWQQILEMAIKKEKELFWEERFSKIETLEKLLMLLKMKKNFDNVKIGDLLNLGGAPEFWQLLVEEEPIGQTTSSPFPGVEYDHGFILSLKKAQFLEGESPISLSNNTAGRSFANPALFYTMVALHHSQKTVKELYIKDAELKAEKMRAKEQEPPYLLDYTLERFADGFIESQGPVIDDIKEVGLKFTRAEAIGIQYAMAIDVYELLSTGVNKYSKAKPHAFVLTSEGWELAE